MYNYYYPWYDWTRVETGQPYYQNYYQPQPFMNGNGSLPHEFNQEMYGYQNPYMYGYNYQGHTENANPMNTFGTAGAVPKSVISYFQDENGQLDIDKMMSTTGQVVKTVQEVSPIVKGIGSFVKGIK